MRICFVQSLISLDSGRWGHCVLELSAARPRCLCCFLHIQPALGFSAPSSVSRYAAVAASMMAFRSATKGLFREKSGCGCDLNHTQNSRVGCNECSNVCRASNVSRSLVANTRLAGTERGLFQAVLCESWKESLKDLCPFLEELCDRAP